jgi:hypothetical protein
VEGGSREMICRCGDKFLEVPNYQISRSRDIRQGSIVKLL